MLRQRLFLISAWLLIVFTLAGCNLSMGNNSPQDTPVPTKTLTTDDNNNTAPPAPFTALPTIELGATATADTCEVRTDWEKYIVARGDNLSELADQFNSTVQELITANCLANPNSLRAGQLLYVPKTVVPPVTATSGQ